MSTILASSIIDRAVVLLQDPTNVRWPRPELLVALNAGQRALVLFKPNAYTKNISFQLATGSKQNMPPDALDLIELPRNLGVNGTTPGDAIRLVKREILDAQIPNWHRGTASASVKHYVYNSLDLKHFYVYPPQPATATGQVEMIYTASPSDVLETDPILVDDIYEDALLNYIMFRAYSKDVEYAANATMAAQYYGAFKELLTGKTGAEAATNPNAMAAGNPNA